MEDSKLLIRSQDTEFPDGYVLTRSQDSESVDDNRLLTKSKNWGFPDCYYFPPFFTVQPNLDTQKIQMSLWSKLICRYFERHKIFFIDVNELTTSTLPFANPSINRAVTLPGLRLICNYLQSKGQGEWVGKDRKTKLLVHWREASHWGDAIYEWANRTGRIGRVESISALQNGEDNIDEAFHNVPIEVLHGALRYLETARRCEVFCGEIFSDEGVKFFPPAMTR